MTGLIRGRVETIGGDGDPTGHVKLVTEGLRRRERPHRSKLFPSNSSVCPRQGAAGMLIDPGFEVSVSPSSQFYFKIGNGIQDVLEMAFNAHDRLLMSEYRLDGNKLFPGLNISGRIDLVIIDNDGGIALVEAKSCGKLPDRPKRAAEGQAMVYSLLSGIDRVYVVYQSRNPADWSGKIQQRWFPVDVTPASLKRTALVITRALKYAAAGLLPAIPSDLTKSSDVCTYCPLKGYCWEGLPAPWLRNRPARSVDEIGEVEASALAMAKAVYEARPEFLGVFMGKVNSVLTLREAHGE